MWPILFLIIDAIVTVGAFSYLSLGMPHQLYLVQFQAISVGTGVLISVIIAFTLRGEEENGKRPLWPMLLPVLCAIFAMGIYYALMIGSPQVMDMLVLQGYSVGAGTLLIILISIPFWRGMRPAMSLVGVSDEFSRDGITEHERLQAGYETFRASTVMEASPEEVWSEKQDESLTLAFPAGTEESGSHGIACEGTDKTLKEGRVTKIPKLEIGDISSMILGPIQKQVDDIVSAAEKEKNEIVGIMLDGVSEIEGMVTEYKEYRQNAQGAIENAVQNMITADEKLMQIEQRMAALRNEIAEKTV